MSDDLVKQLRDDSGDWLTDLAADRIEELEDKLDWVLVERDETFALMWDRAQTAEAKLEECLECNEEFAVEAKILKARIEELEAKLAKAVEVLSDLADCVDDGCFCSEIQMAAAMDAARTTIAELTGGKDEDEI